MNDGAQKKLLSKPEIDYLFRLNRSEWETMAANFLPSGWMIKPEKRDTGLQITGYKPASGCGFSIHLLHHNDTDHPIMVTIGNYFPERRLPNMTHELRNKTEALAQRTVGSEYRVKINYFTMADLEAIEFILTKA